MTTPAHKLLDHLLNDLKTELCANMQQDIVLELEKKQRDLQNMVADMLAERREEMFILLMNRVHQEIIQEFEMMQWTPLWETDEARNKIDPFTTKV